jgi:hypothetical protein
MSISRQQLAPAAVATILALTLAVLPFIRGNVTLSAWTVAIVGGAAAGATTIASPIGVWRAPLLFIVLFGGAGLVRAQLGPAAGVTWIFAVFAGGALAILARSVRAT